MRTGMDARRLAAVVLVLAAVGASGVLEPGEAAARIPGTATLSGTVAADAPFTAARVYIRNVDRRMLYMVYTQAGRYRAVALFPGNYEVSVRAPGRASDMQRLVLNAGDSASLDLSLRAAGNVDSQNNVWFGIYAAGPRPGKLVKLDQSTGRMTEHVIPQQDAAPYDVAIDAGDNIWAADVGQGNDGDHGASIWKFDPGSETFTFYPKPQQGADSPKIQVTRQGTD